MPLRPLPPEQEAKLRAYLDGTLDEDEDLSLDDLRQLEAYVMAAVVRKMLAIPGSIVSAPSKVLQ